MMSEKLEIKLVVDDSEANKSLDKFKRNVNSAADGSSNMAKSNQKTVDSMEELADTMSQIRGLQVFDLLRKENEKFRGSVDDVKKKVAQMKTSFQGLGEEVGSLFSFKDYDVGEDGIKGYIESAIIDVKETMGTLKGTISSLGTAFKSMGSVAVAALNTVIAKAVMLLATLGSVFLLVRNGFGTSALAKQTNVLAQQAGMSVDTYQKWAYVLGQVGLEVDDMIGAQQTLLEAQVDVREGAEEIITAFQKIGLSQEEVLKLNQQQLFEKTVEGLQGIGNATERATIAFKLLSEDAKNLAPLLNLSSEQVATLANNFNTLNGAMSQGLIESSNRLQTSIGNLKAAWQGLRNTLAELVLPVIVSVVNWLTKAVAIVNLFIRTVFGLDIGGALNSGVDDAAGSMGGYTSSVKSATSAVEKLKRTTMGFDELNIVSNPNASSASGGGGGGGDTFGGGFAGGFTDSLFNADALDMSMWQEKMEKYRTTIQDMTTWGLIGVGVGAAVIGALSGNLPLIAAGLGLAGIGFAAGNAEDGTFDRLRKKFQDLGLTIAPAAMTIIGLAGAAISMLTGNIPLAIGFAALAGVGLGTGGGADIEKFAKKYKDAISTTVAPSIIAIGAITAGLALMTGNIPLALAGLGLVGVGLGLGALSNDGLSKYISDYGDDINRMINTALLAIGTLAAVFCLMTGNVPGAIAFGSLAGIALANIASGGSFFKDAIAGVGSALGTLKNTITGAWDSIKQWFSTSVAPKFTATYWSQKFSSIKDGAKSAFNGVMDIVQRAVNRIIQKINTLSWTIPDWVPSIGGKKFGFNFKQISIPRLAEGGIAVSSTLANIGENGKEAVLPLDNNTQWMDRLAERIAEKNSTPTKIVLKVGEKELGWASINGINQITKQTGELQLVL